MYPGITTYGTVGWQYFDYLCPEEDEVFIITKDKDEQNMVLEQLADHNIEYEILGKNLYSLYILTLYKGIDGDSDA